jgi:HEAT repeat protein
MGVRDSRIVRQMVLHLLDPLGPLLGPVGARANAGELLQEMGPAVAPYAPLLVLALRDRDIQTLAANVLGEIGPAASAAAPFLGPLALDSNPVVHYPAMNALAAIGEPAAPTLRRVLAGGLVNSARLDADALDSEVNRFKISLQPALHAIEAIGESPRLAALLEAELTEALRSPYLVVRLKAARVLPKNPRTAAAVVPVLVRATGAGEAATRAEATALLGELGPAARSAVPRLTESLLDPDPCVRRAALLSLARVIPHARTVVPLLVESLTDPAGEVRVAACDALGRLGPAAGAALPALRGAARDRECQVRVAAAIGIARVTGRPKEAVPLVREAAASGGYVVVNRDLLRALIDLKCEAEAVHFLLPMMSDADSLGGWLAAYEFRMMMREEGVNLEPPLRPLLKHPDFNVRTSAHHLLYDTPLRLVPARRFNW